MGALEVLYPLLASGGSVTDEMLADDSDWLAQEKIDGSRYMMFIFSEGNRFTSRQKSRQTGKPVEKTENVPHLHNLIMRGLEGTILDGEMQHKDFSQTVSIMGSKPEKAVEKQKQVGWIDYKVFDIVRYKGIDVTALGYSERMALAEKVVAEIKAEYPSTKIQSLPVYTKDKMDLFHSIVTRGGEGLVLKHKDSPYVVSASCPSRSKEQIKLKKYITDDVVIMGATKPTKCYSGKDAKNWEYIMGGQLVSKAWYNGWIGAIRFGKYVNGSLKELGQTSGIEDDMKILLSDGCHGIKKEFIGKTLEIGAMEQIAKTGAYRHPRFIRLRPDKNPEECIY